MKNKSAILKSDLFSKNGYGAGAPKSSGGEIKTWSRPCPHCGSDSNSALAAGYDYEYRTCPNEFSYVKCNDCGLAYSNPMPLPSRLDDVYPDNYISFHFNTRKKSLTYKVRDILEWRKALPYRRLLKNINGDVHILDVGCGDGHYMSVLKRVNPNWRVSGIESASAPYERAASLGLDVIFGKYEDTELGRSQFDLMILNQVIEHLVDPGAAIEKLRSELKPGGHVSLETPSLEGLDAKIFSKSFWGAYHFPRHLTLFTSKTLSRFLEARGFEVVRISYMLSPVWWVFSSHHAWEASIGKGAGFFNEKNALAMSAASALDAVQILLRGKTSNMRVLARKK